MSQDSAPARNVNAISGRTYRFAIHGRIPSRVRTIDVILDKLQRVTQVDTNQWSASCPAHTDVEPSLSIHLTDHGRVLMYCHAACEFFDIVSALGVSASDLMANVGESDGRRRWNNSGMGYQTAEQIAARQERHRYPTLDTARERARLYVPLELPDGDKEYTETPYVYQDASGQDVAAVLRYDSSVGKSVRQASRNDDGTWSLRALPAPRPLYRLPELLAADPAGMVFVLEGEGKTDHLCDHELLGTTCAGGANGVSKTDLSPLECFDLVVILPDHDASGMVYALAIARHLTREGRPVKLVELPGLTESQDFADWRPDATIEDRRSSLLELVNAAPIWKDDGVDAAESEPTPESNGESSTPEAIPPPAYSPRSWNDSVVVLTPTPIGELAEQFPEMHEPIIDGLLRRGETMNIIGPSKLYKSHLVQTIGFSVATGGRLFGRYACTRGRVLILDNELHGATLVDRAMRITARMGIPNLADLGDFVKVVALRDQADKLPDIDQLKPTMEAIGGEFDLIILDSFYRFLPAGMSENDNSAMAHVYNAIDRYAALTEAAFILIHHPSKGNQSDKSVTDVGAARDQCRERATHT